MRLNEPPFRRNPLMRAATSVPPSRGRLILSCYDLNWRVADAKLRGVYKGRKATIDTAKIKQMKADGAEPSSAIAETLKIGCFGLSRTRGVIGRSSSASRRNFPSIRNFYNSAAN